MLCYCKRCGRLVGIDKNDKNMCDYCQSIVFPVPTEFLIADNIPILNDDLKEQFINDYIKSSPEFDPYLFEHRTQDLYNRRVSNEAKLAHGKAILEGRDKGNKFNIECPYCKATNIKKITTTRKFFSTGLLGLASNTIGKSWHCTRCGSDF